MMGVVRIAAVSYLNTIPFVFGLEHADKNLRVDLLLDIPRLCVDNFSSGSADIALVPVAALSELKNHKIITPYCLSAEGAVDTVMLLSNTPIQNINTIYLDSHSRTSNELIKILCRDHWHITPSWQMPLELSLEDIDQEGVAYLMIGDKVFDHAEKFLYRYDLATEWSSMTGLPFVFAVWVAREDITDATIDAVESMLEYGISHIEESVRHYRGDKCYDKDVKYLTQNIKFRLNQDKRRALELFIRNITSPYGESGSVG